jgi:PGF-pre-PGF domain-containing protein
MKVSNLILSLSVIAVLVSLIGISSLYDFSSTKDPIAGSVVVGFVNATLEVGWVEPEPDPRRPSSSSSIFELISNDGVIRLVFLVLKDRPFGLSIKNPFNTGLDGIYISANNLVFGRIEIRSLEELPVGCEIPSNLGQVDVYKVLQFNSSMNNKEHIEEILLTFAVEDSWIRQEDIKDVVVFRCLPSVEILDSKRIGAKKTSHLYEVSAKEFSVWVIAGLKEVDVEYPSPIPRLEECCLWNLCWFHFIVCWYWWVLVVIGIILLIYYLKKRYEDSFDEEFDKMILKEERKVSSRKSKVVKKSKKVSSRKK